MYRWMHTDISFWKTSTILNYKSRHIHVKETMTSLPLRKASVSVYFWVLHRRAFLDEGIFLLFDLAGQFVQNCVLLLDVSLRIFFYICSLILKWVTWIILGFIKVILRVILYCIYLVDKIRLLSKPIGLSIRPKSKPVFLSHPTKFPILLRVLLMIYIFFFEDLLVLFSHYVRLFATPQTSRHLCPWDSPGKNTGVGCHFLLQEIFLTQKLDPCLLH